MSINTLSEHALSGHEAIEALNLYIEELENTKVEGLEISLFDIRIKMARAISQAIRNTEESEAGKGKDSSKVDTSTTKIKLAEN